MLRINGRFECFCQKVKGINVKSWDYDDNVVIVPGDLDLCQKDERSTKIPIKTKCIKVLYKS
jgi:hypothetical protein